MKGASNIKRFIEQRFLHNYQENIVLCDAAQIRAVWSNLFDTMGHRSNAIDADVWSKGVKATCRQGEEGRKTAIMCRHPLWTTPCWTASNHVGCWTEWE